VIAEFALAACAEMIFTELPFADRVRRIDDLGFQVEIWDWTRHDIESLRSTGATFSSMTGYVTGDLIDSDGADELVATAKQSIPVAARLGIPRLNLHGTGLDGKGLPIKPLEVITGEMWLKAVHTLDRLAKLGKREGVTFCLENLNTAVDHPGTPLRRPPRSAWKPGPLATANSLWNASGRPSPWRVSGDARSPGGVEQYPGSHLETLDAAERDVLVLDVHEHVRIDRVQSG
jgi:hypothetical protein